MTFDFDQPPARRHTGSIKWDFLERDGVLLPRPTDENPLLDGSVLPLHLSDMDFQAPPAVLDALRSVIDHGILGYTRPGPEYFAAITDWMATAQRWNVAPDWIVPTMGTMGSVNLAIQTFTDPGDGIIVQPPVFGPIIGSVADNGRRVVRNPLRLTAERYEMDLDDLRAKASDPANRMLILCSPHNPVGRVWTSEELLAVSDICREHDLIVVADEVHGELHYSWGEFVPIGTVDPSLDARLVVCAGPSKTFNMPGMRTSLAIIPEPALRSRFVTALDNLDETFSVSVVAAAATRAAYESGGPWLAAVRSYIEGNYVVLRDELADRLPEIRLVPAEGLYLAWLDCRGLGLDDREIERFFLEEAKVELEWGVRFGREGSGFVRLNLACPRSTLEQAIERIVSAAKASGLV